MELYDTHPKDLDKFIADKLQPTEEYLSRVRRAVDLICDFLKDKCFKDSDCKMSVSKIVKGGSSAKGTALSDGSDADLVVFLNCFKSYEQQKEERSRIICEIKKKLKETNKFEVNIFHNKWPNPRSISFNIQSTELLNSVDVDLLLAYDALDHTPEKPDPEEYEKLLKECCDPGEYSVCFTELQRDFIRKCPTKVKSLIRLVKHWYKEYVKPQKKKLEAGQHLPPKYALELLVVYVWENGNNSERFKMAEAFYSFLKMVRRYEMICIYWTTYYGFENEKVKKHLKSLLAGTRPIIVDPADPTGNVAAGNGWKLLADEATVCLGRMYGTVDTVLYWNVPPFRSISLTVKLETQNLLHSSESPDITVRQIKEKMYPLSNIPVSQQCLMIEDDPETGELMDSKQLLDYGIFWNISLCVSKPQPIHIFVKNHAGTTKTYEVTLKDRVLQLKTKIEKLEGVAVDQQKLIFCGHLLEDTCTLEHYQIKEGSVIFLTLRLRGGR